PGPEARATWHREAGVEEELGRRVVELIGLHRLHQRDLVDDLREVGKRLAEFRAALPIARKLEARPEHRGIRTDKRVALPADDGRRQRLAFEFRELGLVIEHLELRRRAR